MRKRQTRKSAAARPGPFPRFGSGLSVTTKGRYGLRMLVALARHTDASAVALRDLGGRLDISEKYLWHVARLLTSAGLIRAERGTHGGYRLARLPETITLLEVVEALEGPCELVPAAERDDGAAGYAWREIENALRAKLQSLTLRAVVEQHDAYTGALSYVI